MSAVATEAELVDRALAGDRRAFDSLVEPYRRELHVHCYRMLASLHDAEDLLQESLLRAWQGLSTFKGKAPVRAWLYKIATNTCLNHLRRRPRVVVPAGADEREPRPLVMELLWLEPYPDAPSGDPAERAVARSETSLAFLCAVQLLPPLQRAVLILRDVLDFSAKEVAALLDTTPGAIHSALQRARVRLSPEVRAEPPFAERGVAPEEELLVRRFVHAWEAGDVPSLVRLLAADATLAMPPAPIWFRGRDAIGEFLSTVPAEGHLERIPLVRINANGTHAVAAYMPGETGVPEAYGIMVLSVARDAITAITGFANPSLFPLFDLPAALKAVSTRH